MKGALLCLFCLVVVVSSVPQMDLTTDRLRDFVKQRGLSIPAMRADLLALVARVQTMELCLGPKRKPMSPSGIRDYLSALEIDTSSIARSTEDLFDRAYLHCIQEQRVLDSLKLADASQLTKSGMIDKLSMIGFDPTELATLPQWKLSELLGTALMDIAQIQSLSETSNSTVNRTVVETLLRRRGLESRGGMAQLLSRLAGNIRLLRSQGDMRGQCSVTVADSVCPMNGQKVVAPPSRIPGTVAHWTFDDALSMDISGNGHHFTSPSVPGPGRSGSGASAFLDGSRMMVVNHTSMMMSETLSLSMWLFLLEDSNGNWRTLVHKGSRDSERTPTLMLEPNARGLELIVSTTNTGSPGGERVFSNSILPLNQWIHVAAVIEDRNLRLFINGILDAENTTVGEVILNEGPIYFGNDPWRVMGGAQAFIDDIRLFSNVLSPGQVAAEAGSVTSAGPNGPFLACSSCSLDLCLAACRHHKDPDTRKSSEFHMCSAAEMHGGAFVAARSMGWIHGKSNVWMINEGSMEGGSDSGSGDGVCLCCKGSRKSK